MHRLTRYGETRNEWIFNLLKVFYAGPSIHSASISFALSQKNPAALDLCSDNQCRDRQRFVRLSLGERIANGGEIERWSFQSDRSLAPSRKCSAKIECPTTIIKMLPEEGTPRQSVKVFNHSFRDINHPITMRDPAVT